MSSKHITIANGVGLTYGRDSDIFDARNCIQQKPDPETSPNDDYSVPDTGNFLALRWNRRTLVFLLHLCVGATADK